jgi:hypothetical protein
MPLVVWGQSQNAGGSSQDSGVSRTLPLSQRTPKYRQYASYIELRQGTTEKMAICVTLGGLVTSPRNIVPGIAPLELQLDNAEGISAKGIRYPKAYRQKFAFRPDPIPVVYGDLITFTIRADRDVLPGRNVLTGRLKFQLVTASGFSEPQQRSNETNGSRRED